MDADTGAGMCTATGGSAASFFSISLASTGVCVGVGGREGGREGGWCGVVCGAEEGKRGL